MCSHEVMCTSAAWVHRRGASWLTTRALVLAVFCVWLSTATQTSGRRLADGDAGAGGVNLPVRRWAQPAHTPLTAPDTLPSSSPASKEQLSVRNDVQRRRSIQRTTVVEVGAFENSFKRRLAAGVPHGVLGERLAELPYQMQPSAPTQLNPHSADASHLNPQSVDASHRVETVSTVVEASAVAASLDIADVLEHDKSHECTRTILASIFLNIILVVANILQCVRWHFPEAKEDPSVAFHRKAASTNTKVDDPVGVQVKVQQSAYMLYEDNVVKSPTTRNRCRPAY